MSREITYAFNAVLDADERLQDAALYLRLEAGLGDRLVPRDIMNGSTPGTAWGRDWLGILPARQVMAAKTYADTRVRAELGGVIVAADTDAIRAAAGAMPGAGLILRNLRDPAGRIRYTRPHADMAAHLRAIGTRPGDEILCQPWFELQHMRRFMVVAGEITGESPMLFDPDLATVDEDDFADLQVSSSGNAFVMRPKEWRHMQHAAVLQFVNRYPLLSGAVDVGLELDPAGTTPIRARIESVTAAPPGGLFSYMADLDAHADAIAANADVLAPAEDAIPDPALE